ncbi:MAG: hypothetical protein LBD47_02325 [Treponema sp.]|jgi:hypothetical protein|nr:hypothetical protein [Treponema sp.]
MRTLIIALAALTLVLSGAPLFAQQISPEHSSEYFYENVYVEKIYPSRLGYILQYRKGINGLARMYIPNEWFTDAASKGELIYLPPGNNWPSVTVYFKNGEFSHLRLYVHRWRGHETWGNVPLNVDITPYFDNVETVKLEF